MIGTSTELGGAASVLLQEIPAMFSSLQLAEHPSPETLLPSSHSSPGEMIPSPQTLRQVPFGQSGCFRHL